MKKIAILTTSRADIGLLNNLIQLAHEDQTIEDYLIVTGSHLSPEFGLTVRDIIHSNQHHIETLLASDTPNAMAKGLGLGVISFADLFSRLKPHMLVILGDRYEALSAAQAAYILHIPIAHIGGGEETEGSLDNAFRSCITHMARLHFVYSSPYWDRIWQLRKSESGIYKIPFIGLEGIEKRKPDSFFGEHIVCIWHPESKKSIQEQRSAISTLLSALSKRNEPIMCIQSGADAGGRLINDHLEAFAGIKMSGWSCSNQVKGKTVHIISSLSRKAFLKLLYQCKVLIGNSSAGIYEAPALGVPSINVGDRQKGRLLARSIISCKCTISDINRAFEYLKSDEYKKRLNEPQPYMPYGNGGDISKTILEKIKAWLNKN